MKFRKRPIVVDAEQFHADAYTWPDGVYRRDKVLLLSHPALAYTLPGGDFFIWNERGECWQRVEDGDWIIRGVSGCRYPCKKDIFPQIYEKVEEPRRRVDVGGPDNICGACGDPDPYQTHGHG